MSTGNKNITSDIWIIDTHTDETKRYDNKKLAAAALGVRMNVIDVYLDKNRLYKQRYILRRGEVHEKKTIITVLIPAELLKELKTIVATVPNANLMKLTNAICKDYVFRYESGV
jgi:hypothetical protein